VTVTYNIHEAKTHFSRLVQRVLAGEEVVIAKAGKPVAKIVPVEPERLREPDRYRGRVRIAKDFDAPLPADLLDSFEGRS
jgi:prevent-host-death family protein